MSSASVSELSPDQEQTCLSAAVTQAVQAAVRSMNDAAARRQLWDSWSEWLAGMPALTPDGWMPWDPVPAASDPGAVLSVAVVQGVLSKMLADLVHDEDSRAMARTARQVIAAEMDRLDGSAPDMSNRPRCAWCGRPIPPERGPLARFCTNSHRVRAAERKARERAGKAPDTRTSVAADSPPAAR